MEVQLDPRMMALGAILTVGSEDSGKPESELAILTRRMLARFASHPLVTWLREQIEKYELLTLAMQVEQLGGPPCFLPNAPDDIPRFVDAYFSAVPRTQVSECLARFWRLAELGALFESQESLWQETREDMAGALRNVPVEEFQSLFYGSFPYLAVAVPAANMPPLGVTAVGTADNRETRAVCLPYGDRRYREHTKDIIIVAQHEASHVIVDNIQSSHPTVTEQCFFSGETFPAASRFAASYRDADMRFVETLIRASTCFFLEHLGRQGDADAFLASQLDAGVSAISIVVDALRPWWKERLQGRAGGLDVIFPELPARLRSAAGFHR